VANVLRKTLDAILQRQRQKEKARAVNYRQLVEALADDKEVGPETAEAALDAAGKSADDLLQEVERVKRRREFRKIMERCASDKLDAQYAALAKDRESNDQDLEKAKIRHAAAKAALEDRQIPLDSASNQASYAAAQLRDGASPELKAKADDVRAQIAKLTDQQNREERKRDGAALAITEADETLARKSANPKNYVIDSEGMLRSKEAGAVEVKEAETAIAAAGESIAVLKKELAAIERRMLHEDY
jgi:hypothetical protein